jgi:hypothetical protein
MRHDTGGIAKDFIGDGTGFDEDVLLFAVVDEERVFVEGESVTETTGTEEDGGVEVLIGGCAAADCFAGVEEERDVDVLSRAFFLKPLWSMSKKPKSNMRVLTSSSGVKFSRVLPGSSWPTRSYPEISWGYIFLRHMQWLISVE